MLLGASADMLASAATRAPFEARLTAIDRNGANLRVNPVPQSRLAARVAGWSPARADATRLAADRIPTSGSRTFERGTRTRITTTSDLDVMPVWSPDGLWLAHRSGKKDAPFISVTAADGTGVPRRLECPRLALRGDRLDGRRRGT